MRVLNIIPQLSGGGAEAQLGYMAVDLVRSGIDTHIAYASEGPQRIPLPGVSLHQLASRHPFDPFVPWQLVRLIRDLQPDVVHTWILQMDVLGGMAALACGKPWVLREPSSAPAYAPGLKTRMRVLIGRRSSAVISNSLGGDRYWSSSIPARRRHVIRNGLPLHLIDQAVPALPPGLTGVKGPLVVYAGRLTLHGSGRKGLVEWLRALAIVKRQTDVCGVLCGDGPHRPALAELIRDLSLTGHAHVTGSVPTTSVWSLMKRASVFVSLSRYEGCPNAVLEAMACGCPLVLSDIPAHREILDESCALFVDPSDIAMTADAIHRAVSDAEASRDRARVARRRALGFSIPHMVRQYEQVYRSVLRR